MKQVWIVVAGFQYESAEVVAAFGHAPSAEELQPIKAQWITENCRPDYWEVVAKDVL